MGEWYSLSAGIYGAVSNTLIAWAWVAEQVLFDCGFCYNTDASVG